MKAFVPACILTLTALLSACAPTIAQAPSPTETVPPPATETSPPTSTVTPEPPTEPPSPEPTVTETPAPRLDINAADLQSVYEEYGFMFTSVKVDGKPASRGTYEDIAQTSVHLIGDPSNIESISLAIPIVDAEYVFTSMVLYIEPILTARGLTGDYLDLVDELFSKSKDAINNGATPEDTIYEDLIIAIEVSEDEIIYHFMPKP